MLRNILLLLVMLTCMLSGYFIGDYRGKKAREALEDVIRTGEVLDDELKSSNSRLKSELDTINEKYKRDVQQLQVEYDRNVAEWQRNKSQLDNTIRQQGDRLAGLNRELSELITMLGRSSGVDKIKQEQKIAMLRADIDALMKEMNGNSCLRAQAPQGVIETLNSLNQGGRGR